MNFALSTTKINDNNGSNRNIVRLMDYGDIVILYIRHDHMESLLLERYYY